jgi:hypothetical protein
MLRRDAQGVEPRDRGGLLSLRWISVVAVQAVTVGVLAGPAAATAHPEPVEPTVDRIGPVNRLVEVDAATHGIEVEVGTFHERELAVCHVMTGGSKT